MQTIRILHYYRKAQEWMRRQDVECDDVAAAQLKFACAWSGADERRVFDCVDRWIEKEPLELLVRCRMPLLAEFLEELRLRGIRIAVCSDYPAAAKLRALGIAHLIGSVSTAQDVGIQRFKPHPRQLENALAALHVHPSQAVYCGDRPEVDGVAAARAGVRFISISPTEGFKPLLEMLHHE